MYSTTHFKSTVSRTFSMLQYTRIYPLINRMEEEAFWRNKAYIYVHNTHAYPIFHTGCPSKYAVYKGKGACHLHFLQIIIGYLVLAQ